MILCCVAFKGFCFDHFEQRFERLTTGPLKQIFFFSQNCLFCCFFEKREVSFRFVICLSLVFDESVDVVLRAVFGRRDFEDESDAQQRLLSVAVRYHLK